MTHQNRRGSNGSQNKKDTGITVCNVIVVFHIRISATKWSNGHGSALTISGRDHRISLIMSNHWNPSAGKQSEIQRISGPAKIARYGVYRSCSVLYHDCRGKTYYPNTTVLVAVRARVGDLLAFASAIENSPMGHRTDYHNSMMKENCYFFALQSWVGHI